jgi:hypothetical protein
MLPGADTPLRVRVPLVPPKGTNRRSWLVGVPMFSEEEKKAFQNQDIRDAFKVLGEYSFYLEWGDDYQIIKIRLEESIDGKIQFVQSHYIKTPAQASHSTTSRSWAGTADDALKRAVNTVMSYYSEAIKAGYKPDDGWFVKNKQY